MVCEEGENFGESTNIYEWFSSDKLSKGCYCDMRVRLGRMNESNSSMEYIGFLVVREGKCSKRI